jgi:predicted cobalt transporter CbtA
MECGAILDVARVLQVVVLVGRARVMNENDHAHAHAHAHAHEPFGVVRRRYPPNPSCL